MGSSLWSTDRGRKTSGLVCRWLCMTCRHHSKMDSYNTYSHSLDMSIVHIHKNIKICYVNDFIIFIYLLLYYLSTGNFHIWIRYKLNNFLTILHIGCLKMFSKLGPYIQTLSLLNIYLLETLQNTHVRPGLAIFFILACELEEWVSSNNIPTQGAKCTSHKNISLN